MVSGVTDGGNGPGLSITNRSSNTFTKMFIFLMLYDRWTQALTMASYHASSGYSGVVRKRLSLPSPENLRICELNTLLTSTIWRGIDPVIHSSCTALKR